MLLGGLTARLALAWRLAVRRAVLGVIGGLLIGAGLVFLFVALWILLAGLLGSLGAALIFAGVLLALGLLVLFLARRPRVPAAATPVAAPPPAAGVPPVADPAAQVTPMAAMALTEALLLGIDLGRKIRRR